MSPRAIKFLGNVIYLVVIAVIVYATALYLERVGDAKAKDAMITCLRLHDEEECEMLIEIARLPQQVW